MELLESLIRELLIINRLLFLFGKKKKLSKGEGEVFFSMFLNEQNLFEMLSRAHC